MAKAVNTLTTDFPLAGNDALDPLGVSLVKLAIFDEISEGFFFSEYRHFCSVLDGAGKEGDLVSVFVDLEVLDEPLVLRLANDIVTADASQVCDEDVFVFLDEYVSPDELDEWVTEELSSQVVVILFENEKHRALLHVLVGGPLGDAREEDDEHLVDCLLVQEMFRSLNILNHKFSDLFREVRDRPVLESLNVMIYLKLLAKYRSESTKNRLVKGVDLDRLRRGRHGSRLRDLRWQQRLVWTLGRGRGFNRDSVVIGGH